MATDYIFSLKSGAGETQESDPQQHNADIGRPGNFEWSTAKIFLTGKASEATTNDMV